MAAIAARRRLGNKPKPYRHYILRGLVHCACGTKMRGEAHVQRGTEIRYYRCPTLGCRARRCPAEDLEADVLGVVASGSLPDEVVDAARLELRERLSTPETRDVGSQRRRLAKALESLRKQHAWGDIGDAEYQEARDQIKAELDALPEGDRVAVFDAYRARLLDLPDAIAAASPARREELCRIVLERVVVSDRKVERSTGCPQPGRSSKNSGSAPKGIRTPDLHLERVAS